MRQRRRKYGPWLWLIAVASLLLISRHTPLGQQVNLGIAPLLEAMSAPVEWWQEFSLWWRRSGQLQAELLRANNDLKKQAALLSELQVMREENRQMRRLLEARQIAGFQWHAAKISGRSPDEMSQRLIVFTEGAKPDDVVVTSDGLVGLVDEATPNHAAVRTILDAAVAVPVTVAGKSIAALVRGKGNTLQVAFVPWISAPEVGTILVTSGAGGEYPAGIPVARIVQVSQIPGDVFANIVAEPVSNWRRDSWLAIASRD